MIRRYEDFPKKCLKCHSADVPLERYHIAAVKAKYLYGNFFSRSKQIHSIHYTVKFLVCRRCKRQLKLHEIIQSILIITSLFYIIIIPATIILFLTPNMIFLVRILPLAILVIITITLTIIVRMDPHRIQNFIEITKDWEVNLKDPAYEKEVSDYRARRAVENRLGINKIACPKCGFLINRDSDFCSSCGKDLRL